MREKPERKRPLILFWDVDGTLVEVNPEGDDLHNQAVEEVTGRKASPLPSRQGKVDRQNVKEYLENANVDSSQFSEVFKKLESLSSTYYRDPRFSLKQLEGVSEALKVASQLGVTNALFTGNSRKRSEAKLEGAGFSLTEFDWEASFFGSEFDTRPLMAEAAAKVAPGGVIIGDTPGDGIAAQAANYIFVAVCTGVYGPEDLAPYDPVAVFDSFGGRGSDFSKLISSLSRAGRH